MFRRAAGAASSGRASSRLHRLGASGLVVALTGVLVAGLGEDTPVPAAPPAAAETGTQVSAAAGPTVSRTRRPNVVIVVTDDQRIGTLQRMPQVQSMLVEKGTRFTNAMVPTALCCPSRSTLLTGLYAHNTRVYSNGVTDGGWRAFRNHGNERRTLATTLRASGYRTGLVGKYLNGFAQRAPAGYVPPGWNRFLTFRGTSGDYYDYGLSDGTKYGEQAGAYSTDVLAKRAAGFIRSTRADQPLFLYFAPFAPHAPFKPAPRHENAWTGRLGTYRPPSVTADISRKPRWVRTRARGSQVVYDYTRARQQESLMAVDDAVARLVGALRDAKRMRNTLFIYLSDNGYHWGDHHLLGKDTPYRFSTEIPMVVRWDGRVPANRLDHRIALNVDVAATVNKATSTAMRTDGLNMFGVKRRGGVVLESTTGGRWDGQPGRPGYCGWRTKNWLYVRYVTGEREMYSYRSDPYELHNKAWDPKYRVQRAHMHAQAKSHCVPRPPGYTW